MERIVNNAILFIGVPAGILVGLELSGQWSAPQLLLNLAYTMVGVILVAAIFVGIFSRR